MKSRDAAEGEARPPRPVDLEATADVEHGSPSGSAATDTADAGHDADERGDSARLVLVCGAFHHPEVSRMIGHARSEAASCGIEIADIVWVPGAMEMPLALQRSLGSDDVDCAACLGIIEAGETQHGLAMGQAVIAAVIDLQLETGKPIGLGIIGPGAEPHHVDSRLEEHARAAVRAAQAML